jgi:cysteine synthase A
MNLWHQLILTLSGAQVVRVPPVSITHPEHPVNIARRTAEAEEGAIFANQFENLANLRAHLKTGAEIWRQTKGRVDVFVSGAGTGGTVAGVSQYLKGKNPKVQVFLVDPPGSSLYNKVRFLGLHTDEAGMCAV